MKESKMKLSKKQKPLYDIIILMLYAQREDAKTNKHYTHGDFTPAQAVQYALNCAIGNIKTEKEHRKLFKKSAFANQ